MVQVQTAAAAALTAPVGASHRSAAQLPSLLSLALSLAETLAVLTPLLTAVVAGAGAGAATAGLA